MITVIPCVKSWECFVSTVVNKNLSEPFSKQQFLYLGRQMGSYLLSMGTRHVIKLSKMFYRVGFCWKMMFNLVPIVAQSSDNQIHVVVI